MPLGGPDMPGNDGSGCGFGVCVLQDSCFSCNVCNREIVQIWRGFLSVMLVCGCCVVCSLVLCMCGTSSCADAQCVVVVWVLLRTHVTASFSSPVLLWVRDMLCFTTRFGSHPVFFLCSCCIYAYVSVSRRLACPSVPVFSRVAAPGAVAILM